MITIGIDVRDVEFIKIPLLLVFLPALSRQVFVA
ncbi:hypothetical protein MNBD_GAMMA18-1544 [hydrothermal vent metagenome]|uniref:Uncharacterized protein n=1 Tax=hydrothermal vent metagenome TaxID=652676 RepID=A0A3B1A7R2_9ZZZZ